MKKENRQEQKLEIDRLIGSYQHKNDENALRVAFSTVEKMLYPFICFTLNDSDTAKDILQEAWLKALANYKPQRGKFFDLIKKIAKNDALKFIKRRNRHVDWETAQSHPNLIVPSALDGVEKEDMSTIVHKALARLPDKYRIVIELHYFDGKDPSEIAKILSIPWSTVRSRLARGLKRLRIILEKML